MKTHITLEEKIARDNAIYKLTVASRGYHPVPRGKTRTTGIIRMHDKTEYIVMPNGSLRRTTLRRCGWM